MVIWKEAYSVWNFGDGVCQAEIADFDHAWSRLENEDILALDQREES